MESYIYVASGVLGETNGEEFKWQDLVEFRMF